MKTFPFSFFFLILFLDSSGAKRREAGFLFIYPKVLTSSRNETVCVSIYEAVTPFRITVDLKIRDKHYFTRRAIDNAHDCFEITVPKLRYLAKDVHYASMHLQIELNKTIQTAHSQGAILIYSHSNKYFVETDRSFYKPGELVRIRILILNNDLKPPEYIRIPEIKVISPSGLTVNSWKNVVPNSGLVHLEHQLSEETIQGKWKIEVNEMTKFFTVKEYNLPRFKVQLENPRKIYADSSFIKFTVCAKYSYGKHVEGSIFIKISFKHFGREAITQVTGLTNGCGQFVFSNEDLHLREQVLSYLTITAVVTEQGTNRIEATVSKSHIINEAYRMKFSEDVMFFQPGFPYKGRLIVSNALIDLKGELIQICYTIAINHVWNIQNFKQCSNFTFDNNDGINFSIPPLKDKVIKIVIQAESLNQTVKEEWPTLSGQSFPNRYSSKIAAYYALSRWYSPSRSYISLEPIDREHFHCRAVQDYVVSYQSNQIDVGEIVNFHYLIKSRSKIFQSGRLIQRSNKQHSINVNELQNIVGSSNHSFMKSSAMMDSFSFKLRLGNEILWKAQLLLYFVLKSGETVASSVDVSIERCLPNKIEARWALNSYKPGGKAKLNLKTSKDSLCAISSIDKSSFILGNTRPLNVKSVLKPFVQEKDTKQSSVLNCIPKHSKKPSALQEITSSSSSLAFEREKRSSGKTFFSNQFDSFDAFDGIGVGFMTNLNVLNKQCEEESSEADLYSYTKDSEDENKSYQYNIDDRDGEVLQRTLFPETWLWELISLKNENEIQISRTLPHSITNFVTTVLCLSPTNGIGLTSSFELSVFQPFFLEVLSPRTIKRNEVLHLQTIAFNYLNYSIPLKISLLNAKDVDFAGHPNERTFMSCIHPNENKVAVFKIKSSKMGKINLTVSAEIDSSYPGECGPEIMVNRRDEVVKTIIVEAEGYRAEKTKSIMLCSGDPAIPNNVSWILNIPSDFIRDSEKAVITIDADLIGPTIRNIEKLINVPTGCGEQLVSTIAPNLYILRYLNATGKLTGPMRHKLMKSLKIGYQKILTYAHADGSFSAFGYYDPAGSMFLTSFIIRTLTQLNKHVYVDQIIIDRAVEWILMNQLENGCFNAVSHVFHNMGGTSAENSTAALTSYVIISMLESGIELTEKVRTDAQYCIRGHHSPDKYTLAISSYALTLIGLESEANRALKRLLEIATVKDNLMWWSSEESVSTNIEMTAYALMTLLSHPTPENLIHSHSVVRWLITQRNAIGGFVTSQDTSVALDAISRYMTLIRGKNANLSIHLATNDRVYDFTIKHKDNLKMKQITLSNIPNSLKVIVNGEGCILVTSTVYYNLEHMTYSEAFKLAVDVESVSSADKCSIAMVSPCLAYKMPDIKSNMAVLQVKMPTGYEPDRASLYMLQEKNPKVKRFEDTENQVNLYFTELSNEPICVPFTINENAVVDRRVDAEVKLFDYYNPEMQAVTTYHIDTCRVNGLSSLPNILGNESITFTSRTNNLINDSFPGDF